MRVLLWLLVALSSRPDGKEVTDRLVPPGWTGNPWGPAATAARQSGKLPPVPETPEMKQWDRWGRQTLQTGDILFRRGDARVLHGYFPFSRFTANVTGSRYSHTGTVVFENGEPVVYDTTNPSVRRQPLKVWVLDNVGPFGVKRLKPAYRDRIPKVVEYLHQVFQRQLPFDWELSPDDRALYCVEMAEKAFRHAGLRLSEPVLLSDMENINQFPICVLAFTTLSDLKLEQPVFFPGNTRHGIWASPYLETIYESPALPNERTTKAKTPVPPLPTTPTNPPGTQRNSVAGIAGQPPRN